MIESNPNGPSDSRIRIYPRGKKQIYTADFWHAGKHHRVSLKTRNAKEARRRANRIECQLDEGNYQPAQQQTKISAAINAYIEHLRTEGRRHKTVVKYRGLLDTFERFCADRQVDRMDQIGPALIDSFRSLRKMTHSPKSMHNEGVTLKGFLRWSKQRRLIAENPMAEMRFRRPPLRPRARPTLEHIDRTVAAAHGQQQILISILAFTGMRSGELQRLQAIDVDLIGNWIHVVSREGLETKTGTSRKVPIHPRLRELLLALPKPTTKWFFTAAPSRRFPNGEHFISSKRLNDCFLKILAKLGLPTGRCEGFTIHSLRHFFETTCVNAGIPQRVIDTWLGHRSDRSMASVYYGLADEESQRFMKMVPFGTGMPAADASDKEVSS